MSSPFLILELVGMGLALAWWRRHPRVSLLVLLGVGWQLLTSTLGTFLFAWLPDYVLDQRGWSFADRMALLHTTSLLLNSLGSAGTTLLLFAIFIDRVRPQDARQPSRQAEDLASPDVGGMGRA
jgi:hypothetical protein